MKLTVTKRSWIYAWNITALSKWKPRIEIIKTNKNCYNNLYKKLMIALLMVVGD
jgi:hypothetical protein